MGKRSRKAECQDCACGRRVKLNGWKIPAHVSLETGALCLYSGNTITRMQRN